VSEVKCLLQKILAITAVECGDVSSFWLCNTLMGLGSLRRRDTRNVDNAIYIYDVPSSNNKLHITSCCMVPQMRRAEEYAVFSHRTLYVCVYDFETHFFRSGSAIFLHVYGINLKFA